MNFESVIEKIDNDISIKKEDRKAYADLFDIIRDFVLKMMQEEDEVFKYLYNGPSLFGSYIDNVKVDKPDEFDLHFVLKLPYNEKMIVSRDPSRPGFVNLDISKVIQHTANDPNVRFVNETLKKLVDYDNILSREKLQNWIEEIMLKVFSKNQYYDQGKVLSSQAYNTPCGHTLSYSKCATAHTIKCFQTGYRTPKMSMDFVPAFKFTKCEGLVLDREFPVEVKEKLWFAVPKPMKGDETNRKLTFSVCAPQIERYLLTNKKNLKPSLRLFKSLRDKRELRKLKSYFIKSIYLHEYDKQSDLFWEKPIGSILIHMIGVLLTYLRAGKIPFYWAPDQNLLKALKQTDIDEIIRSFQMVEHTLKELSSRRYVDYNEVRSLFDKPDGMVISETA